MKEFRVNVKGNKKFFVILDSLKEAQKTARENARRNGATMEIYEKRGNRFYLIETVTK